MIRYARIQKETQAAKQLSSRSLLQLGRECRGRVGNAVAGTAGRYCFLFHGRAPLQSSENRSFFVHQGDESLFAPETSYQSLLPAGEHLQRQLFKMAKYP